MIKRLFKSDFLLGLGCGLATLVVGVLTGATYNAVVKVHTHANTAQGGTIPGSSVNSAVATATALAANGTNCSSGNYPLGVDASGNAESCSAVALGTQAADTVVMNATGGTAAPTAVSMPTCTAGADLYNTLTHGWSCVGGADPHITPIVLGDWSNIGAVGTTCTKNTVSGPTGGNALQFLGTSTGGLCGVQIPMSGTFSHVFGLKINYELGGTGFGVNVGFTDGTKWEACGIQGGNIANNLQVTAISGGSYSAANGSTNITSDPGVTNYFKLERTGTTLNCYHSVDGNFGTRTTINDTVPALTPSAIFVGTDSRGNQPSDFVFFSYQ